MGNPNPTILYISIGIFVILVFTAIYIGRLLYKERVRKDLENRNKQRQLELGPLPDEVTHESSKTLKITPKSSLENSSIVSSSQGKERKSSFNIERNSKSLDRTVKPSQLSRDSSVNGSSKYSSMNDSRYSRNVSKASSLVIKIPKVVPPPPPSPLKSQDDSVKTLTNNIIPSDISGSTYTPPLMSSTPTDLKTHSLISSQPTDLKTHSLMSSQPTTHVNHPEFELA